MTLGNLLAGPIGWLVILRMLFGNGEGGQPGVPKGPFPSVKPETLPPWPSGWCPDLPPPPEVQARGWELLPDLWAKGEGAFRVEMVGGRYIRFVAMTSNGQKAVGAYRSVNCEAVPSVLDLPPPPVPADASLPAAIAMNDALKAHGYKQSDQPLYRAFQSAAGLTADGYPGTVTMMKLELVLKNAGYGMAPVKVYPWKATGAYDGQNAPTQAEWGGQAPAAPIPSAAPVSAPPMAIPAVSPAPAAAPTVIPAAVAVPTTPTPVPSLMTNTQVQHNLNLLGYKGADGKPLAEDGIIGANSKYAIGQFQQQHPPLAVDQIAGPQTKAALAAAMTLQQAFPSSTSAAPSAVSYIPTAASALAPVVTSTDVQHALNRLGYLGKDGKPLVEDGVLGTNSKFAIAAFQKEHPPLAVDSVAGPQTKAALSTALMSLAA